MGITGLLPFLEKSSKRTNIQEFSGGTVAIDSYCWLHKGVFSCAEKLMMGQTTDAYVSYCMKYINMLLQYKIKPILVFDGRRLPAKEQTEIKRRDSRNMNRRKAMELIQMGQVAEGKNLLKRAIDVTHEIALELIKRCQKENVDCIVAPYEADAQLAYLNIIGIADVVITEDSDLTLFGCKRILFKMDFNGNGVLIEQDRLHLAMNVHSEQFHMDKFRHICILSGCDYLPSLPGIGLRKAQKFIDKNTDDNIHKALTRLGSVLNMKSLVVTAEYRDAFVLADITFKHQLVFCPLQRKQVRLNPPTADITEDQLQYAGTELNADIALQLAFGNCDPCTLKMVHNFDPDKIERKRKCNAEIEQTSIIHTSIWSDKYKLKTDNHRYENTLNSSIKARKELCIRRDSLKNENISLKYTSPTIQCDRFSEYQDLGKNAILDMYNSNQNTKLILSPEKRSKEYLTENNVSPELFKTKNPFVKRVSDLTTSPSILSQENCRKRGRNLMRVRRTIIDENIIVESKYFSKHDNEKSDALKSENNVKDFNLKRTKRNENSTMDVCDASMKRQKTLQDLKVFSEIENVNANLTSRGIDDTPPSNLNKCLTNSYENISERTYSSNRITEISPTRHFTTVNDNCISDNLLVSSSDVETMPDLANYENTSSLRDDLSKWSNTKGSPSLHKKTLKKKSSMNSISPANSVTGKKQLRQSKQLTSVPRQQSLLSMYGFHKRSSLKH
ncbi:Exonuclease [Ooceraea biroi]|uniref:Exonuclease 1 n=1 Tax=Ooceraea biroi TaxID=2015173 RepID=A0A026W2G0_OOCBI|nr:Exonuclease [Ooceraea biroi]